MNTNDFLRSRNAVSAPSIAALFLISGGTFPATAFAAVNSYRFMHVTINTPWHIFLFLMIGVFAPFILMIVLMWRYSFRKNKRQNSHQTSQRPTEK